MALSAGASVPTCDEPGCETPVWTVKRRGECVIVSIFCVAHSNVPLLDVPAEPIVKLKRIRRLRDDGGELLDVFASEIRRRRLERAS